MSGKIKLSVTLTLLGALTLFGLFGVEAPILAMTCDSATLTGFVVPNGNPTSVWFEYGTNQNVVTSGGGIRTQVQVFTSNSYVSQLVTGLNENTTYYFRIMLSNRDGSKNGEINSFTTPACPTTPPPP